MAQVEINKSALAKLNGKAICFMVGPEVVKESENGRWGFHATVSMEHASRITAQNVPIALIRIHELIETAAVNLVFIIAASVGFVNVVESKELVRNGNVSCIVDRGHKRWK